MTSAGALAILLVAMMSLGRGSNDPEGVVFLLKMNIKKS
jgi:hypothetical protein